MRPQPWSAHQQALEYPAAAEIPKITRVSMRDQSGAVALCGEGDPLAVFFSGGQERQGLLPARPHDRRQVGNDGRCAKQLAAEGGSHRRRAAMPL